MAPTPPRTDPPALSDGRASDTKVVVKGGAIQVAGQIANRALTFLFLAVGVRVLGTEGFGAYKQIFQILTVGTMLAAGGFPWAALRFIAQARAQGDPSASRGAARVTIVATSVVSGILSLVVVVWARPLAALFADTPSDVATFAYLLQIGAAYIAFYAVMQTLRSCTQAYKTMLPAVMVGNIIQPISRLVLGIFALLLGFALTGAIATLVVSAGLAVVAGVYYYRRILSPEERGATPKAEVGPILRFTLPQAGVTFFGTGSLGLGVLILGIISVDRQVGLFSIATSLQTAGNVFATGIVAIFAPVVVDLYERGEITRLRSLYQTINRWLVTFSFPIFAALLLEPGLFIHILAGGKAEGAIVLVPILAVGNVFRVATGPSSHLLSMTGRPTLNFLNSFLGVALYVALGFWLVPTFGAIGMAAVDSAVTLIVNAARVIEVRLILGIGPFGRSFVKPVAAILVAAIFDVLWQALVPGSVLLQVLGLALAGGVYLVILKLAGLDPEEQYVFDAVKRRRLKRFRRRKQ